MTLDLLKNKTILITGGTGFFGKTLKDYYLELDKTYSLNLRLVLTARNQITKEDKNVEFISHDIRNPLSYSGKVDYVIHAATPVANDKSEANDLFEIIINGTQNILNFCKEKKVEKLVNISSGAVYGKQPSEMYHVEECYSESVKIFDRNNIYGTGKRLAEILVNEFCLKNEIKNITLRGFAFSGNHLPLEAQFAIGNFVKDAKSGHVIKVNGDGTAVRSYLDGSDLAEWVNQALLSNISGEIYNLGSDQEITIGELAHTVASLVKNVSVEIQNKPNPNIKSNRYVPSVEKIKTQLGVQQKIDLKESILKMLN